MATERLHKFMARCGVASRRQAEEFIVAGRVAVNEKIVTELGVKIDPDVDVVNVDHSPIKPEAGVCYLLHKPSGYAATVADELGRKTVLDLLPPQKERVYPAGRLDIDSEGLVILTNDGEITFFLTHPSRGVKKIYEATVDGNVDDDTLNILLEKGVFLGSVKIKPLAAKIVRRYPEQTVVRIIVAEGVNREVRRLFAALGHEVKKLVRLEIGPFKIDGIKRGEFRRASAMEMQTLQKMMAQVDATSPEERPRRVGFRAPTLKPRGKPDPAQNQRRRPAMVLEKPRRESRENSESRDTPPNRENRFPRRDHQNNQTNRDDTKNFRRPPSRDSRDARDSRSPRGDRESGGAPRREFAKRGENNFASRKFSERRDDRGGRSGRDGRDNRGSRDEQNQNGEFRGRNNRDGNAPRGQSGNRENRFPRRDNQNNQNGRDNYRDRSDRSARPNRPTHSEHSDRPRGDFHRERPSDDNRNNRANRDDAKNFRRPPTRDSRDSRDSRSPRGDREAGGAPRREFTKRGENNFAPRKFSERRDNSAGRENHRDHPNSARPNRPARSEHSDRPRGDFRRERPNDDNRANRNNRGDAKDFRRPPSRDARSSHHPLDARRSSPSGKTNRDRSSPKKSDEK